MRQTKTSYHLTREDAEKAKASFEQNYAGPYMGEATIQSGVRVIDGRTKEVRDGFAVIGTHYGSD